MNCRCGPPDKPCFQVFSGSILRTVVLPPSTAPEHLWCPPHRSCHLSRGKAECMHASIACLLLYEDYVWVSLGNAMKAKQSKAIPLKLKAEPKVILSKLASEEIALTSAPRERRVGKRRDANQCYGDLKSQTRTRTWDFLNDTDVTEKVRNPRSPKHKQIHSAHALPDGLLLVHPRPPVQSTHPPRGLPLPLVIPRSTFIQGPGSTRTMIW